MPATGKSGEAEAGRDSAAEALRELTSDYQAGDRAAFAELYARSVPRVRGWLASLAPGGDAEDLTTPTGPAPARVPAHAPGWQGKRRGERR